MELSEPTTRYAVCAWKLVPGTTIRASYPEKIQPELRAKLDELTSAGLLARQDDPRGPVEWKPTPAMAAFVGPLPIPADLL